MKLLWLCNRTPGLIQAQMGKQGGGLWLDHVLTDLRAHEDITMEILCPGTEGRKGQLDPRCCWELFPAGKPWQVLPRQKELFLEVLRDFQPDVIHIWGSEFGHTLNMMEACRELGLQSRAVISIQGLCSIYAPHYSEGLPISVQLGYTLRDLLRWDNIRHQQKVFFRRGENEKRAMALAEHLIGRTHWDRACAGLLAPQARYHFCNETLREAFYRDQWQYASCSRHRIFASSREYPIKGFHYLLEAFSQVLTRHPDAVLAVPGTDPLAGGLKARLRQDSYARYLRKLMGRYGLAGKVEFLGHLSEEQMKKQYLQAHVFALPSTIENSPNSMGEAMLLGTPVAAADVGGVTTMLEDGREGLIYQGTAPYMLADCICRIFAMEDRAEEMGARARAHALRTHEPRENLRRLLEIYADLAGKDGSHE